MCVNLLILVRGFSVSIKKFQSCSVINLLSSVETWLLHSVISFLDTVW